MNFGLIKAGRCTVEDLVELNEKFGYRFVIEDGEITGYTEDEISGR